MFAGKAPYSREGF
jgi:hypothetical protein